MSTTLHPETITLSGPFVAENRKGLQIPVSSIVIASEGYIPDVSVNLDLAEMARGSADEDISHGLHLHDDETFLGCVMARLKEIGYEGPAFGRAELGMQDDGCVVLEPAQEFNDFAFTKGWVYADGMDEYRCSRIMAAVDGNGKVKFQGADGTAFSIRLSPLIEEHSDWHKGKFGGERDEILVAHSIPLFRDQSEDALKWLREEADWGNVMRLVTVDEKPVPDPKEALMADDAATIAWSNKKKARP